MGLSLMKGQIISKLSLKEGHVLKYLKIDELLYIFLANC